jgi:general secretion pathway protein C
MSHRSRLGPRTALVTILLPLTLAAYPASAVSPATAPPASASPASAPAAAATTSAATSATALPAARVRLDLDGVPLARAAKTMSEILGKPIIVESGLRRVRLTVFSPAVMTREQAWRAFRLALEVERLTAIDDDGMVRVVHGMRPARAELPAADAGRAGTPAAECTAIAKGAIRQTDDTHWVVRRAALDTWRRQPGCLTSVRVVPYMHNGRASGFRLYGIRRDSVAAALGARNGDVVESVDGVTLDSPASAFAIYGKLGQARSLSVQLLRRGTVLTQHYRID